jgi:hypothetical protein
MLHSFTCLRQHTSTATNQLIYRCSFSLRRTASTPLSITSLSTRFHSSLLWSCQQHTNSTQRTTRVINYTGSNPSQVTPRLVRYSSRIASPPEDRLLPLRDTQHLLPSVDYQLEPMHFQQQSSKWSRRCPLLVHLIFLRIMNLTPLTTWYDA